jgi:uncharacterized tannase-like protein DUF6351
MKKVIGISAAVMLAYAPLHAGGDDGSREESKYGSKSIRTLSTHADRVSGGNVLVEVSIPKESRNKHRLQITLNGRDVTAAFRPGATPNTLVGLLDGLVLGKNTLKVDGKGIERESLEITNYSIKGPITSGPYQQPFICQTQSFNLPAGLGTLGAPLDADCSVATRVDYVYISTAGGGFRALPSTSVLPADVAMTTTRKGVTMPFVVRVETGTMNRGIYQNTILHDPTTEPQPGPFSPPKGWNKGLISIHGAGCPGGWYRQGAAQGVNPLNTTRLGEGYALFINTLQHPSNSCNPFLAAETTMMGKEHFIETFGVPAYTISMGGSGGAYTTLDVGDALPGLFDGAIPTSTFPDAFSIANSGLDGHLLTRYFAVTSPTGFSDEQKVAISGYKGIQAWIDAANQSQRTDPVSGRADIPGYNPAVWNAAVPAELRYHPVTNQAGARPTVFDASRNIYGIDRRTGFALRPWDNVGVQYGLKALNSGAITVKQFLDLNEGIGGYDNDANYVPYRTSANPGAIKRAYQAGMTLHGGGGLAIIPVLDGGNYNDTSGYHYAWYHFAVRERMQQANGYSDNHVSFRGPSQGEDNWSAMVRWVEAIKADQSDASPRVKMRRNKPADVVDGCWVPATPTTPRRFIAEPATFGSQPDSECNTLYPSYAFPRYVAGGPLAGNIIKCRLKRIDLDDYAVAFTGAELARLRSIFPDGVCDWSKRGVGQTGVVPWASFGPSRDNLVFDVTHQGDDDDDDDD